jgi:hypothetical protein
VMLAAKLVKLLVCHSHGCHRALFRALRSASRTATAFLARSERSWGGVDKAAFLARAVRCSGVIEAAAFVPPLLPIPRRKSRTSVGSFFLGIQSA